MARTNRRGERQTVWINQYDDQISRIWIHIIVSHWSSSSYQCIMYRAEREKGLETETRMDESRKEKSQGYWGTKRDGLSHESGIYGNKKGEDEERKGGDQSYGEVSKGDQN